MSAAKKIQPLPKGPWPASGHTAHSRHVTGVHSTGHFSPTQKSSLDPFDINSTTKSTIPPTPPLTPASIRASATTGSDSASSLSPSHNITDGITHSHHCWDQNTTAPATSSYRGSLLSDSIDALPSQDASLPSPTSPINPKSTATLVVQRQEQHVISRFLIVSGIPKTIGFQSLKQTFMACGELKGIFIRFHREHGIIILAFFDLRHAARAHRQISTSLLLNGICLAAHFIPTSELRAWIGESDFVNQNNGELVITTSFVGLNTNFNPAALQNVLASFGDLHSFRCLNLQKNSFQVEYFDARDAFSAMNALNGHTIHGVRLHINFQDTSSSVSPAAATGAKTSTMKIESRVFAFPSKSDSHPREAPAGIPFPSKGSPSDEVDGQSRQHLSPFPSNRRTLHHSISEQNLRGRPRSRSASASPSPPRELQSSFSSNYHFNNNDNVVRGLSIPNHLRVHTPPQHVHGRRISNIYHFDSVGRTMLELPPTAPPRPRSISVSSDMDSPVAGRLAIPPPTSPMANMQPELTNVPDTSSAIYDYSLDVSAHWPVPEPLLNAISPVAVSLPQSHSRSPALKLQIPRRHIISRQRNGINGALSLEVTGEKEKEKDSQPERNKIDIGKIERGEETRTTVMIKNIPNKMTDRHLTDFINEVCPRAIDFLYLRMDFTNGCNVGYAFVNFIHVEDLLHFAKTKLGTKWNLFSSEKVLGMSYANYQGKEALIDKFRSSSIMDQREAWRPKLFYSSGSNQGLPEEFPAPTHTRRKERSNLLPHDLHQSRTLFHHSSSVPRNYLNKEQV